MTALLLQEQGYECIGAHMSLWKDTSGSDAAAKARQSSVEAGVKANLDKLKSLCERLGIELHIVDLAKTFKKEIVDEFLDEYRRGETPNPCVRCNRLMKFGRLLEKAKELGCTYIATGHYVQLLRDPDGTVHMNKGQDSKKDQSYFLYSLSQETLKHVLFPLGEYSKPEIRKLAAQHGFNDLATGAESQDVCFYPDKNIADFLKRHFEEGTDYTPGKIKNEQGEVIGDHKGLPFYTLGQRRGLNIGGGPALYVKEIDHSANELVVGSEDVLTSEIALRGSNFVSGELPPEDEIFDIRIRHHGQLFKGRVQHGAQDSGSGANRKVLVKFEEPQRAVMPGQSLVLYRGEEVIGGGIMA